jgi:hypothetical protein
MLGTAAAVRERHPVPALIDCRINFDVHLVTIETHDCVHETAPL